MKGKMNKKGRILGIALFSIIIVCLMWVLVTQSIIPIASDLKSHSITGKIVSTMLSVNDTEIPVIVNSNENSETKVSYKNNNLIIEKGDKKLEFSGVENNQEIKVGFDSKLKDGQFIESYAIDPSAVKFESAKFTTIAKGDSLYKCKEWNFTEQICHGEWIKLMDISPGQEYSFRLTAYDPAFGEQPGSEGKDTYIVSGTSNYNFGADNVLKIKGDENNRILVEFNLSSIPSDAIISNATLQLYVTVKGTVSPTVYVHRINQSWTEGTGTGQNTGNGATWNSRNGSVNWNSAGADFDTAIWANTAVPDSANIWASWNITNLVQNWINGTYPNYGMLLKTNTTAANVWTFASSDNTNVSIRPKINITYAESAAPQINSAQMPSSIRENSTISLVANVTDNDAVSMAIMRIGNVNYSMSQTSDGISRIIYARPITKGTFESYNVDSYKNAYDNLNSTYSSIILDIRKLMIKTAGISASGTINSVKIKVIYSAKNSDVPCGIHWATSPSVQGIQHPFTANNTIQIATFDVTAEKTWSFADFNAAEIHINKTGDNIPYIHEAWFEINYTSPNSATIWNATIDSSSWPAGNYNYTIYANDTSGNTVNQTGNFTIFPRLVRINASVYNANGTVQAANIQIYDTNNQLELNETIDRPTLTSVEAGTKEIIIGPINNTVQNIEMHSVNVTSDTQGFLNIDNPADNLGYNKLYAIDPTAINFTNATVTVTASGNELYKCKDWNFTSQTCYGEWTKFMDIVPGQTYTFTLTANDPGFGEVTILTYILHNESDAQYSSYKQMKNVSADIGTVRSEGIATDFVVYQCWNSKWLSPNWTAQMAINGTYNFTIYTIADQTPTAAASVRIFKYNATSPNEFNISTSQATPILLTKNVEKIFAWTTTVPSGQYTNLTVGERVGIQVCANITVAKAGGFFNMDIEQTTPSFVIFPNTSIIGGGPMVNLVSPNDGNITALNSVNFTCNATTTALLTNITFYWNYSGSFIANGTTNVNGTSNSTSFSRTGLNNGAILWNCLACDNASQCAFASANYIVTVNVSAAAPSVNLSSPANNTQFNNTQNINFNFTVTGRNSTYNCSIYLDDLLNQTNATVQNNTLTNFLTNGISYATHNWKVNCSDGINTGVSETRTLIIADTINPAINFTSPSEVSGSFVIRRFVMANVSASDSESGLKNITIYLFNSTGALINSSNSTSSQLFSNFSVSADGIYYFNATSFDNSGNKNSTETRNVTIDTANPSVNLTYPLNVSYTLNVSALNYTVSDANLQACWYSLNNGQTNTTIATCGNNLTGLTSVEGNNTWLVGANDSAGNQNLSRVTFFKDTINPSIVFANPTQNSSAFLNRNNFVVNVSANDANLKNVTLRLYNQTALINTTNTTSTTLYINYTSLAEGIYYFNATACDTLNNCNSTETRNSTIDTINPAINFTSPSEISGSSVNRRYIRINVTSTDTNLKNITVYLYNATVLINTTNSTSSQLFVNFTVSADGIYYFNATAYDNAGNSNSTETRNVTIDTRNPSVTINSPLNTTYNNKTITVDILAINIQQPEIDKIWYNWNGTNITYTNPINVTFNESSNTLYAYANDTAGNIGTNNVTFFVDTTPPASITNLKNISSGQTWIYWNWTNPANPDFNSSIIFIDGNNVINITYNYYNATGFECTTSHTITVWTKDNIGNINNTNVTNTTSTQYCPDIIAPIVHLISPANNILTNQPSQTFSCNITDNGGIANLTLYIWNSTGLLYINKSNLSGIYNSSNFNYVLPYGGTFMWNCLGYDTSSNYNWSIEGNYSITLDTIAPLWSNPTESPSQPISYLQGQYYQFNITWDGTQSSVWYNWNGTNYTNIAANGNVYSFNKTDLAAGNYSYRWFANDSAGNLNQTGLRYYNISKAAAQTSLTFDKTTPQNYTTAINASCYVIKGEGNAILYRNSVNVTAAENNQLIVLAAGNHDYECFLAETQNYTSATNASTFIINKAAGSANLLLNGTATDLNMTYGSQVNASASTPYGGITLYRNGVNVTTENNVYVLLGVNYYNYTAFSSGNQNYSNASISRFVNISKATPTITSLLNGVHANLTVNYPQQVNASGSTTGGTLIVYRNGIAINNGQNYSLGASYYQFDYNVTGNQNYTDNYDILFANVTKGTGAIYAYLNNSRSNITIIEGTSIWLNATLINGNGAIQLYSNNSLINSGTSPLANLTAFASLGSYNVTSIYSGNQNYTNAFETFYVRVVDAYKPTINFTSPTEISGSILARNNILVNVTANDTNLQAIIINIYNSTSLVNSTYSPISPFFVNFTGLADGIYYFNATANDTSGNENSTGTRNVTIDTTNPSISIIYPQNATYNINVSALNYTVSDINLQACWYSLNGGANATITCGNNLTGRTSAEGSNTWIVYANDSLGHKNYSIVMFSKDTIKPLVQFVAPTTQTGNYSQNFIIANATASDTNLQTIIIYLYNSTSLVNSASGTSPLFINFSSLNDGTYYLNATSNDTFGNANSTETRTIILDTANPGVEFVYPTETSGSYINRNNIKVNISVTDANFKNVTARLHNSTGLINTTASSSNPFYINFVSLADGIYYFNATAYDIAGNYNYSGTRNVIVDTISPKFNISQTRPALNTLYAQNSTVPLRVNATDENGIANVNAIVRWDATFELILLTFNSGTGFYESTFSNTNEIGKYNVTFNSTDIAGNSNTTLTNFTVYDSIPPVIIYTNISNYAPIINETILIDMNATDNFAVGSKFVNITLPNGTVLAYYTPVYFNATLSGRHNVTFIANDTTGNIATAEDYFIAGKNVTMQFNVINSNLTGINNTLTIYLAGTNKTVHIHDFIGNYVDSHAGTIYDLLFNAYNDSIEIKLRDVNITLDYNRTLGIDKSAAPGFLVTYGINNTYAISNATVELNYSGLNYQNENYLYTYRCADWNFESKTCSGTWTLISSSQNKTSKTFSVDVSGFSGFSIKDETPIAPVTPEAPSMGGGVYLKACEENWTCTSWNCTNGYAHRECKDLNNCGTIKFKPVEKEECVRIPGCFDRKLNGLETDIDCGGVCPKCLAGQQCLANEDCITNICYKGRCTTEKPEEKPIALPVICWWIWMLILLTVLALLMILNIIDAMSKPSFTEKMHEYLRAKKEGVLREFEAPKAEKITLKSVKIKPTPQVVAFSLKLKEYLRRKEKGVLEKEKKNITRLLHALSVSKIKYPAEKKEEAAEKEKPKVLEERKIEQKRIDEERKSALQLRLLREKEEEKLREKESAFSFRERIKLEEERRKAGQEKAREKLQEMKLSEKLGKIQRKDAIKSQVLSDLRDIYKERIDKEAEERIEGLTWNKRIELEGEKQRILEERKRLGNESREKIEGLRWNKIIEVEEERRKRDDKRLEILREKERLNEEKSGERIAEITERSKQFRGTMLHFLHALGIYKTESEKDFELERKQRALQLKLSKEKSEAELRQDEERIKLQKKVELENQRRIIEERRMQTALEKERLREEERKNRMQDAIVIEQRRREEKEQEEIRRKAIGEENRRKEELRQQIALEKGRLEAEKRQKLLDERIRIEQQRREAENERLRQEELRRKAIEEEKRRKEELRQQTALEKEKLKEEEREKRRQEAILIEQQRIEAENERREQDELRRKAKEEERRRHEGENQRRKLEKERLKEEEREKRRQEAILLEQRRREAENERREQEEIRRKAVGEDNRKRLLEKARIEQQKKEAEAEKKRQSEIKKKELKGIELKIAEEEEALKEKIHDEKIRLKEEKLRIKEEERKARQKLKLEKEKMLNEK
jgi:hypothetical protein